MIIVMQSLIHRYLTPPEGSFFLFGPRGTGKTTWIREMFPDAFAVNLLETDVHDALLANPMRLHGMLDGNPEKKCIVIDEIQKIPALLDIVHDLMEKRPGLRFVMTGSSARKLRRVAGVDLLGGRAVEKRMHPFLASELGESFSLDSALTEGLVPVVLRHANRREALLSYLALYVREEVQIEGLTRNLGAFVRFLEAVSFSHGSILSATDVSRECGVKRMTVEGYIGILEDLLVATRLPCFQKHAKRRLVAHDKFYFFDTGLFRAIRPKGVMDRPEEIAGMALEGLVHQQLRAWCDYSGWDGALFFWRSAEGAEVDFVVYSEDCFLALEVKHTDRPSPTDFKGLKTFGRDYPLARRVLLYRGRERYLREDGILVVPVDEFLRKLVPGKAPIGG